MLLFNSPYPCEHDVTSEVIPFHKRVVKIMRVEYAMQILSACVIKKSLLAET